MFKYLGNDGEINNEYYKLISHSENKLYEIDLQDGSKREAFKVIYEGKEGYAYHVLEGNVFHFTQKENIVNEKEKLIFTPAIEIKLSSEDFNQAIKNGRTENKEVQLFNIEYYNEKNRFFSKKAYLAKIEENDFFVFKDGSNMKCIPKAAAYSSTLLESVVKLTIEETKEKEYKEALNFFKEKNIKIKELENQNTLNLYYLINQLKTFESKYGNLVEKEKEFLTLKDFSDFIRTVELEKKEIQNENKFKEKFAFDIEIILNKEENKALLKITNVNGKELSVLEVNDVFQETEVRREVIYKKFNEDDDYIDQEIEFIFFDLNNEDKEIKIYENGKIIKSISESNYFEIYKKFEECAFSNNINVGKMDNEINEIIFDGLELRLENISFNKVEWRNFFKNEYEMSDQYGVDEITKNLENMITTKNKIKQQK